MLNFKAKLGYVPLLCLDDGHGVETAGKRTPAFADGRVIRENVWNKAVISLMAIDAQRLGFKVMLTAPEDTDTPLKVWTDRANAAWSAYVKQLQAQGIKIANPKKIAVFYSQHYNAMASTWDGSKAEGVSTHYYPGSVEGRKLAIAVQQYVSKGTPQKNRDIVESNFFVLRETVMPAVLNEAGFMDDPREAALMVDTAFQKETATQALMGICEYYSLAYEPEKESTAQEEAVDAALNAGLVHDRTYWLNVLTGKRPVELKYLTQAFLNAGDLQK
jgi:N-acetylmuramoyl-L-alanine amidase